MSDPNYTNPTGPPTAPEPPTIPSAPGPPTAPTPPTLPTNPPPPPRLATRPAVTPGPGTTAGGGGSLNDQIAARAARAQQAGPKPNQPLGDAADDLAGKFTNKTYDCLTYETLFNQKKFRKTNQQRDIGLYRIVLARVKIFVCQGISESLLKELVDAFFPDLEPKDIVALSRRYCPWQPAPQSPSTADLASPGQVAASRGDNTVHIGPSAIMPYNFKDNSLDSRAIGTTDKSHFGATLTRLKGTWPMWNTASRSSIVKISRVKPKDALWKTAPPQPGTSAQTAGTSYDADGAYDWNFGMGDSQIDPSDIAGSTQFKLSAADQCFSIKTGVGYIGTSNQIGSAGGNKDVLEENSLDACLRSDYISLVDEELKRAPDKDEHLLLLKELLTITEKNVQQGKEDEPGDGMQVRDISALDRGKIYFPPLSIPFVDIDLNKLTRRYQAAEDSKWVAFWKDAYATALGRAKALLMLRYGLQPGSPNAQNFLIEMTSDRKSTGRIVVRDLGDAQLHREVAWALYGPGGALPADGDAGWKDLAKLTLPPLQYECTTLLKIKHFIMETGVIDPTGAYGKVAGTQMRWTAFSALSKGRTVADAESKGATDQDVRARGWQRVLEVNAEWGRAHAESYVRTVETCLGLKCNVDWKSAKDPKRYGQLEATQYGEAGTCYKEDLEWEETASGVVHKVLASPDGQKAIRDYKQRGWKPK